MGFVCMLALQTWQLWRMDIWRDSSLSPSNCKVAALSVSVLSRANSTKDYRTFYLVYPTQHCHSWVNSRLTHGHLEMHNISSCYFCTWTRVHVVQGMIRSIHFGSKSLNYFIVLHALRNKHEVTIKGEMLAQASFLQNPQTLLCSKGPTIEVKHTLVKSITEVITCL